MSNTYNALNSKEFACLLKIVLYVQKEMPGGARNYTQQRIRKKLETYIMALSKFAIKEKHI